VTYIARYNRNSGSMIIDYIIQVIQTHPFHTTTLHHPALNENAYSDRRSTTSRQSACL